MADLFVFYRSFWDAIKEMDDTEQLEMFHALCRYALDETVPNFDSPIQRAVFAVMKPVIDANVTSRETGKRGGRPRKPPFQKSETGVLENENGGFENEKPPFQKSETNKKQETRNKKQEQEASIEENAADAALKKTPAPAENPRLDTGLSEIIRRYEDDIGSFPRSALDSLQRWRQTLGDDLIALAIGEAAENNARSWRYIDRVLSSWQKEGVRTVGDVQARRERKSSPVDAGPQYERLT